MEKEAAFGYPERRFSFDSIFKKKSTVTCPIIIADYDPPCPLLYEEQKGRILGVIGHRVVAIEHIGSTAVPGLGAKPTIDIMVGLSRLVDARECIEPLQSIGYEYVPDYEDSIPPRRYFRKGPPEARTTHHLHIVELTSDFREQHLLFRDFLRAHTEVAQEYYKLKVELADKYRFKGQAYTDAKTPFIESVMAKARAEKEQE